jgi:hypothetical protein
VAAAEAAWAAEADALAAAVAVEMEEKEDDEDKAEEEDDDDDNFNWSDDDGPDLKEAAAQQRALVESFESQKKLQEYAHACEDEQIRRAVELSLQAAQEGRAGDDALIELAPASSCHAL